RRPRRHDPHIVLQLRHVFFGRRFFREQPREHEFGLEHRIAALHTAVESRAHPAQNGMSNIFLNIRDHLAGIGLIPAPVQVFGRQAELDEEVAGQVLRLNLPSLLAPQPDQSDFVIPHDDAGFRTANERTAVGTWYIPHPRTLLWSRLKITNSIQKQSICLSIEKQPGPPPDEIDAGRLERSPMLTPSQCRAARGLLDWTQQQLADAARVGVATVRLFESEATETRHATLAGCGYESGTRRRVGPRETESFFATPNA